MLAIPLLVYALPQPLLHALVEQGFHPPAYRLLDDVGDQMSNVRLALAGDVPDVPEQLAVWRQQGLRAPVLLLGNGQDGWAVTEALALPVRLGALVARMRFYLNFALGHPASIVSWGDYEIDPTHKILRLGSSEQGMTDKEAAIMLLLAENGQAWGRDDLLRAVWGYDSHLETHTLETHIYRLRRKLAALGGTGDIMTTPAGYQLSCA